jgi:hypothetical protein
MDRRIKAKEHAKITIIGAQRNKEKKTHER